MNEATPLCPAHNVPLSNLGHEAEDDQTPTGYCSTCDKTYGQREPGGAWLPLDL